MVNIPKEILDAIEEALVKTEKEGSASIKIIFTRNGNDLETAIKNYDTVKSSGSSELEVYVTNNLHKLDPALQIGVIETSVNKDWRRKYYSGSSNTVKYVEFPTKIFHTLLGRNKIASVGDLQKMDNLRLLLKTRTFGKGLYNQMLEILAKEIHKTE